MVGFCITMRFGPRRPHNCSTKWRTWSLNRVLGRNMSRPSQLLGCESHLPSGLIILIQIPMRNGRAQCGCVSFFFIPTKRKGSFLKSGYPQIIKFFYCLSIWIVCSTVCSCIFHRKPSSYWGTSIFKNSQALQALQALALEAEFIHPLMSSKKNVRNISDSDVCIVLTFTYIYIYIWIMIIVIIVITTIIMIHIYIYSMYTLR